MKRQELIEAFVQLGKVMKIHGEGLAYSGYELGITEDEFQQTEAKIRQAFFKNGWFDEQSVRNSILAISTWLTKEKLEGWLANYNFTENPKKVAVIMAGNIPLVGFHDFISVLFSGHHILVKMSSEDELLLPCFSGYLVNFLPQLSERITFSERNISGYEAVIATGSNSSLQHFKAYFSKVPNLLRSNRTSIAILDGSETSEELILLGKDIVEFYGKGCRNVTHLLLPQGFEISRVFEALLPYSEIVNNKKYGNNYDYNKAIHLMNQALFLDNNFIMLKETEELHAPISMVHYHYYVEKEAIEDYLARHKAEIQCNVGHGFISFGAAQCPQLNDYADNVDTMSWLNSLD